MATCPGCDDEGWICEAHPSQPAGHDAHCVGPGIPCPNCTAGDPSAEAARLEIGDQSTRATVMSDELPFYAPNKPPASGRRSKPGLEIWCLRMARRRWIRCATTRRW